MPKLVATLVIIAALFFYVRWLVRRVEPRLAFFPTRGEDVTPASLGVAFTPLDVMSKDEVRLRVWHLPNADADAQVVYFHGNGGNLSIWADILVGLYQQRLDVIAFDYRGYGMSDGAPSEKGLYQDAAAVIQLAQNRRRSGVPLIYWGRSLGTTVAAYAATVSQPDGIILEAGFPSMRAVVETNPIFWLLSWVSSYEFPTARWMSRTRAPVLVLHGDSDSVIPYRLGQRLYQQISEPKRFVTIPGGDHNDAAPRDAETYWREIRQFVASLPSRR